MLLCGDNLFDGVKKSHFYSSLAAVHDTPAAIIIELSVIHGLL